MVGAAAAADRVRGPRPAVVPRSLAAGGRRVSERGDDWDHVTQRDAGPVWKRGEGGEGPGRVRVSARGDMVRHRRVGRAGPGRAAVAQISAGSSLSRLRPMPSPAPSPRGPPPPPPPRSKPPPVCRLGCTAACWGSRWKRPLKQMLSIIWRALSIATS